MHRGYIKLWRRLKDSDLWLKEKFTRGQAWVDLLMLANHREGHIRKRGIRIDLKRGEMGWSERELADRWKWSRNKVRRFLNELCSENEQKMEPQTIPQNKNVTSCYKIINYPLYQDKRTTNDTTNDTTKGPQKDRKRYQNKNDKNNKNVKNKNYSPNSHDVKLASRLLEAILNRNPNFKEPKISEWAIHIDRMIRLDKRTPEQIAAVIDWAQQDDFWMNNILSTSKLRTQFDQLWMKMNKRSNSGQVDRLKQIGESWLKKQESNGL